MAHSINRYFGMLPRANALRASGRMWSPAADVYRTREGWLVKVELAGVSFEEIEISIERETLRITGCRRDSCCSETIAYHQLEITYSRFEKTIRFPCPIEGASIQQRYDDGLLILNLRSPESCE